MHLARARVAPATDFSTPEYELKFMLTNALSPAVDAWLQSCCRPHPAFPEAVISSVYYDTRDWRLLNEKINSDFLKTKVRVRWYASSRGVESGSPAFVEAKFKIGAQRQKVRIPLPQPATEWAETPLDSDLYHLPLQVLQAHGVPGVNRLLPAFQVSYRRTRYVHPFSACTVCLDSEIRSPRVHPGRFRHAHPGALPFAVLEQKGHSDRLDFVFEGLSRYGVRKTAFSKYLSCYLHLTESTL